MRQGSIGVVCMFSSRRRHTRFSRDWSSDVCSSDLEIDVAREPAEQPRRVDAGAPIDFLKRKSRDRERAATVAGLAHRPVEVAPECAAAEQTEIGRASGRESGLVPWGAQPDTTKIQV